ncbi:CU044_2847 family protein [Streptomyces sp. 11x1]|uniref:CU044_2847 family protein n=1 Tax=Streptomyces sp. 11x1 TaxID=3038642 RepID=UPI002930E5A6|nr:CU044_2847 family protein [Streptomyces sp. 11x1]WNZ12531.1 CU044_2847 family protein [Streptomyces sp. 11x1]
MSDVVTFSLADGTTVAVAPANSRVGTGAVGLGDRLQTAEQSLREALAPVTAAAAEMMDGFRQAGRRPDEVEVGFAVTLDSKLGGVIASAKATAHLNVKLRWTARPTAPEPGAAGG